jgi:hypothetical protein
MPRGSVQHRRSTYIVTVFGTVVHVKDLARFLETCGQRVGKGREGRKGGGERNLIILHLPSRRVGWSGQGNMRKTADLQAQCSSFQNFKRREKFTVPNRKHLIIT